MTNNTKLTPSSEDYLETIIELTGKTDAVRSVDIASHLHVSKASVNKAMGILREAGLIEQAHYGQIYLTEQGKKQAVGVLQRHSMLKRFLVEILGIDEAIAEQDACKMEHVISDATRDRWLAWLRKVLGNP
ncbi:MAG TPA: metal-dependent transcriptional regulator [Clostridiales bacterium]|nr:metal-dependent transcriptional regulator [Clostridiales bacterium]